MNLVKKNSIQKYYILRCDSWHGFMQNKNGESVIYNNMLPFIANAMDSIQMKNSQIDRQSNNDVRQ